MIRATVTGRVVESEIRHYTDRNGNPGSSFQAYIAENPRYAASEVSGPVELAPEPGELVSFVVIIKPRVSKGTDGEPRPWLSVWAVERAEAA